jgi:Ca2+-binding RTX toxin-like protein
MANRIGTAGADNLIGTDGNDFFDAKGGDDQLTGGKGGDFLDGGDGTDTAHYEASAQGVSVNLFTGTGSGGDAQGDQLVSIENVFGSSQADALIGNELDNILRGRGGADQLNGGDGLDTADYTGSQQGVIASLSKGFGTLGDAEGDRYTSIENLTGSAFPDFLEGDAGVNLLSGGKGNDTLSGGAGADILNGGAGADRLVGGDGDDALVGNATWSPAVPAPIRWTVARVWTPSTTASRPEASISTCGRASPRPAMPKATRSQASRT